MGKTLKKDTVSLGDQQAYKNIFSNMNEEQIKSSEHTKVERHLSTDWLLLPDEIWLKILMYLKQKDLAQFGLSCKKFRQLYLDGSLCNIYIQLFMF